jgi:hypothetical protein
MRLSKMRPIINCCKIINLTLKTFWDKGNYFKKQRCSQTLIKNFSSFKNMLISPKSPLRISTKARLALQSKSKSNKTLKFAFKAKSMNLYKNLSSDKFLLPRQNMINCRVTKTRDKNYASLNVLKHSSQIIFNTLRKYSMNRVRNSKISKARYLNTLKT